jgi:RecA-family ATPase
LAVSISTGTPFLNIETVTARVLLVNGEIRPGAYRKRLRRMMTAMQIDGDALRDRLSVLNSCDATAAATWESVLALAMKHRAAVCIVDPAYLLLGDEIDQMQAKSNVQAMRAFAAAGVTLVNVFHGTKGHIGDRQVIDRISGSGVYARDASTMLSLCEHASEPDHVVLAAVTRNHPPQDARTLVFQDGAFTVADDVASIEKTSKTRSARKFDLQSVANCLPTGDGMKYGQAADRIRDRLAIGLNKAKELLGAAVESGHVEMLSVGTRTEYRKRESV